MKFLMGLSLALTMIAATPAISETPTQDNQAPIDLRADLAPRIRCGDVSGTTWAIHPHVLISAYHVTSHATVACELTATRETAYIIGEDKTADISYLYVEKARSWSYPISCDDYTPGDRYYGAGWPREGFKITRLTASNKVLLESGYWWKERIFYGPPGAEHGQSGGPVVDQQGVVHGLINGGTDDQSVSTSRSLADTSICRTSH